MVNMWKTTLVTITDQINGLLSAYMHSVQLYMTIMQVCCNVMGYETYESRVLCI